MEWELGSWILHMTNCYGDQRFSAYVMLNNEMSYKFEYI